MGTGHGSFVKLNSYSFLLWSALRQLGLGAISSSEYSFLLVGAPVSGRKAVQRNMIVDSLLYLHFTSRLFWSKLNSGRQPLRPSLLIMLRLKLMPAKRLRPLMSRQQRVRRRQKQLPRSKIKQQLCTKPNLLSLLHNTHCSPTPPTQY